jgi:hypothetical protein
MVAVQHGVAADGRLRRPPLNAKPFDGRSMAMRSGSMVMKALLALAILTGSDVARASDKTRRAVPLKIEAFKDGFRPCSREPPQGITGYWELKQSEVTKIDNALLTHLDRSGLKNRLRFSPSGYQRQYLGLIRGQQRIVYISAFPVNFGDAVSRSKTQFVKGCDGGNLFWGIEYDIQTKSFTDFAVDETMGDPLEGLRL